MNFVTDQSNRAGEVLSAADLATEESRSSATPMMEQFIEIKANNPDSLLFYRMGDFYELFFQDAVEASRALGITLAKRGQHMGQEIPMCGVPVHAADDYLQKLIGLGFGVAVCEQVEDPAEAKKRGSKSVVRRDVVRLVTPGTITEEKLLSPSETNYLMALARLKAGGDQGYALAWIDISTGAFRVAETSLQRLGADIARIEPSELIVADTLFHDDLLRPLFDQLGRVVVPQPAVLFDSAMAEGRIARFFGVAALDAFGTFSRTELSAASAAIAYVEKTQFAERPPRIATANPPIDLFFRTLDPSEVEAIQRQEASSHHRLPAYPPFGIFVASFAQLMHDGCSFASPVQATQGERSVG